MALRLVDSSSICSVQEAPRAAVSYAYAHVHMRMKQPVHLQTAHAAHRMQPVVIGQCDMHMPCGRSDAGHAVSVSQVRENCQGSPDAYRRA